MKMYSILWMLIGEIFQFSWLNVKNNISENCDIEILILFFVISNRNSRKPEISVY